MQVAVAGVKHVRAAQRVLLLHLGDEVEHLAQALARNGAVHAVVIRRDASDRRERSLAPRPEAKPLGLVSRDGATYGAGLLQHRLHARDLVLYLGFGAIGLAEQDRSRLEVITRRH